MTQNSAELARHEQEYAEVITLLHFVASDMSELASAYHSLTPTLLQHQPELRRSLLAQSTNEDSKQPFVIVSYWNSFAAYRAWERNDDHRAQLRPFIRVIRELRPETFVRVG